MAGGMKRWGAFFRDRNYPDADNAMGNRARRRVATPTGKLARIYQSGKQTAVQLGHLHGRQAEMVPSPCQPDCAGSTAWRIPPKTVFAALYQEGEGAGKESEMLVGAIT